MGQASGTLPSSSKRCTDQSHNHQYTSVGTSEDFKTGKKIDLIDYMLYLSQNNIFVVK